LASLDEFSHLFLTLLSIVTSPILIWYRNDLRLHDHEPLHQAIKQQAIVILVYCFDPRQFEQTAFGFPKTGAFRAQFLLESVTDLRRSLQAIGSDLIVRCGEPEQVIPTLAKQLQVSAVYCYAEVTAEEIAIETALAKALQPLDVSLNPYWGQTLYHVEDLPFDLQNIPELFTNFRKQVEKQAVVRSVLPTPQTLRSLPDGITAGELPSLTDLGLKAPEFDERSVLRYEGGETAGKARLDQYFWQADRLRRYKETRNEMVGADYSSKFSAWLALGCLSPRYVYAQVLQYEADRVQNDSTYWLVFELLWRDYFRFICAKHGNKMFRRSGLQGIEIPWKQDWQRFDLWRSGMTGFPLVDANMREIAATGYMSNRGRQNVASFLTKNLGIDWRMGAEWFESLLIDYDVCSNWGNWNYTAGVGNDARGFRFFNIYKQAKDYDSKGEYVKHWLPELAEVPPHKVHEPGKLTIEEQKRYGVRIGVDYPKAIVDLFKSAEANEKTYNSAINQPS
jgi:deoxyribodipyrimidine photo-lyase